MRTKEEILAKITELTDNSEKWSYERDYDGEWGGWSVDEYDYDKAKAAMCEFATWLTGEDVAYPIPEPEPPREKDNGFRFVNTQGLNSVLFYSLVQRPTSDEIEKPTTPPQ